MQFTLFSTSGVEHVEGKRMYSTRPRRFSSFAVPVLLSVLQVLLAAGCSDDRSPASPGQPATTSSFDEIALPATNRLNAELHALVVAASSGQGLAHFKQPESDALASIPQDPQNPLTPAKVALGRLLLSETALGVNNVRVEGRETYSCGSCHITQSSFFSAVVQGISEGGGGFGVVGESRIRLAQYDSSPDKPDVLALRSPSVANLAWQEVIMWDGRLGGVGINLSTSAQWGPNGTDQNFLGMQGLETQAIGGLTAHRMHNVNTSDVATNPTYQAMYAAAFPGNPVVNRLNTGLAMAAFERTVMTQQAPFQRWLRGQKYAMSDSQLRGAILFFGKAGCVSCHTGAALSSMTFHGLGMYDLDNSANPSQVDLAPFGGTISSVIRKGRGGFTLVAADEYKFKTPQLYNLKDSRSYGHGGSFATIRSVVDYKNNGIKQNPLTPDLQLSPEFRELGLVYDEVSDLTSFVEDALFDPNMMRYAPPASPLGNCQPVNDPQSQIDLGCTPMATPPLSLGGRRSHRD